MLKVAKIWKLCKTRAEKASLIAMTTVAMVARVARLVPFVLAYLAGVNWGLLLAAAVAIYGLDKAGRALAEHTGELIGKRQAEENWSQIEAKLRALFAQQRGGESRKAGMFEMPDLEPKKAGRRAELGLP